MDDMDVTMDVTMDNGKFGMISWKTGSEISVVTTLEP